MDYTKYINVLALMYAFVLPLSRAGISALTALLIVMWIAEGDLKKKFSLLLSHRVIQALGIFLLFNLVSLIWTDHVAESLHYIKKYWYFMPLIVFFTSLQAENIPKVLSAFILGMFVSEIISYGVFFELWEFGKATVENPSPFMHHIEYSVFLALTALILLGRIFDAEKMLHRVIYIFFFITVSGNLFLTAGRTGQFAFVLGLLVLALVSFRSRVKALLTFMVLSLVILTGALNLSETFHERVHQGMSELMGVVESAEYCTSWGSRVGAWMVSKEIISAYPILGAGIVDNMRLFHHIIETKYPQMACMQGLFMHVHNQYLQIVTQLGIVGMILFMLIFFHIARLKIKQREYRHLKYLYLALLLFAFIPEVIFHRQFSMALFALIVGLLLAQYRTEHEI